jgi:hypothetical protein
MKRALEFLGGAVLVYGLVAACGGSGEDAHPPLHAEGGSAGTTGVGGGSGTGVDSAADALIDSVVDALSEPVQEADAQAPTGPTIVNAPCNIVVEYSGNRAYFAEASFPGKTLDQLARLTAYTNYATQFPAGYVAPPGYRNYVTLPMIQPGMAAVGCGNAGAKAESVTFVLP